jgi:hypothetical protein
VVHSYKIILQLLFKQIKIPNENLKNVWNSDISNKMPNFLKIVFKILLKKRIWKKDKDWIKYETIILEYTSKFFKELAAKIWKGAWAWSLSD